MPKGFPAPRARVAPLRYDMSTSLRLIFNRTFSIVIAINLTVMVIFFLVVVTGAEYVLRRYGTSLSVAGLSSGVTVIGCLAGRLLGGALFSVKGGKKILLYGLCAFSVSFAMAVPAAGLSGIFLARFVSGAGAGLCIAASETIATLAIPRECKGMGISIFSLSVVMGLALGPFLGILLENALPYRELMGALFVVSLPLLAATIFLKDVAPPHRVHRGMGDIYAYIDPRVLPFSVVIMLVFMGYGCMQIYIPTYAAERGLTGTASLFFIVYGITAVASRPFTGRMLDAGKLDCVIYPLFLFTIAGLLLLAWADSSVKLLLAALLCGIGFGNIQSVGQTVSVGLVTPTRYAQATSTYFNLMNLGIGLGPYIFGHAVAPFGYRGMFMAIAATVFFAGIAYHFLHGRIAR